MLKKLAFALSVTTLATAASPSQAMPIARPLDASSSICEVADGSGAGRYRGPGGACHRFGYGPYPGGYGGPHRNPWNGCPPGFWRGPWGHCRDTPYHGR